MRQSVAVWLLMATMLAGLGLDGCDRAAEQQELRALSVHGSTSPRRDIFAEYLMVVGTRKAVNASRAGAGFARIGARI